MLCELYCVGHCPREVQVPSEERSHCDHFEEERRKVWNRYVTAPMFASVASCSSFFLCLATSISDHVAIDHWADLTEKGKGTKAARYVEAMILPIS